MVLTINGDKIEIAPATATLAELLRALKHEGQHFAVALNREFIPRAEYDSTAINDADEVEIVVPLQGG